MAELILRAQEAIDKEDWDEYKKIQDLVRKTYEGENNS